MSEIVRREPEPVEGRIMTPGDSYRGIYAPWEAPPQAVNAFCPLFADCDWKQCWDTAEESREAENKHATEKHGGGEPVARRQRERFWEGLEWAASLPEGQAVDLAARLKAEGRMP